ncbi:hypothetical protein BD414DRAFT_476389 [Trametes punicea]|nr:hypothetical protein BD414DRAFT_476389 [Trametes punicea]
MVAEGWKVSLSREWDVLGPFPIHAREQHVLSPSFPIDISQAIDFNATHPSAYADGGFVGWTQARSQEDGTLIVSYPNIRWEALRATEGWAALQHHSVLRSTLTLYPPTNLDDGLATPPRLLINLRQGSFFTVVPVSHSDIAVVPEWHAGNIYAMGRSPPNVVSLPTAPSMTSPTAYNIFVSGDYEIRLFGDPRDSIPKLSLSLTVDIHTPAHAIVRIPSHDISCDFVDGLAFGDALGVGLFSSDGWWTVESITSPSEVREAVHLDLVQITRLAPGQTRIVPIKVTQTRAIKVKTLMFTLTVASVEATSTIDVQFPIQNWEGWTAEESPFGIKATYLWAHSIPTAFLVTPPLKPNDGPPRPPILALHGAGVDIFENDFWVQAIPRQEHSWIVLPTGRTAWGMDWHGPSAQDAWGTVNALYRIVDGRPQWRDWRIAPETKVLLMGHSNGGQGAWYLASRFPDKVVGVVPAAGYIKSQSYVPWIQSRSAHYVDPAIRAILDSSLTADDNDLFLSNLVDTPVLAIHGGDDDNVPVWHSREAVSVLKSWNPDANVTFREDAGEQHWYPSVFTNDQVRSFVSSALESVSEGSTILRSFTLTVSIPSDSGSLHGWSILSLTVPGRLGRLTVDMREDAIHVRTKNVREFSIHLDSLPESVRKVPLECDGQRIEPDKRAWSLSGFTLSVVQDRGLWKPYSPGQIGVKSPTGRLANILNSAGPLTIVVPTKHPFRELSGALRLAHNLNVYLKMDAEIIDDQEATERLEQMSLSSGNMVFVGLGESANSILQQGRTAFGTVDGVLELKGRRLNEPGMATLLLHPHPSHAGSVLLFVYGADSGGIERALRLFPIRTGITAPDWIIVGRQADERGSGGVDGAGVWGNDWGWNEAMSAF